MCLHPNSMSPADIGAMERFIARHRGAFTSVPEIVERFSSRTRSLTDGIYEKYFRLRLAFHKWRVRKPGENSRNAPCPQKRDAEMNRRPDGTQRQEEGKDS